MDYKKYGGLEMLLFLGILISTRKSHQQLKG